MNDSENKMLSDISVKVGKLEVLQESNAKAIQDMASGVNRLVDKLDKSDDVAREADQRARSAHHRIDDMQNTQRWLIGIVVSAAGVALTAVGFLIRMKGG